MKRLALLSPMIVSLAIGAPCGRFGEEDGIGNDTENDMYLESILGTSEDALVEAGDEDEGEPTDPNATGNNSIDVLSLGCLTLSTTPSPLGLPLPLEYTLHWEFDACRIGWGARQSGTRSTSVVRTDDWSSRSFDMSRDITRTYLFGGVVDIVTTATLNAQGQHIDGTIHRVLDLQENRVRYRPNGKVLFDVDVTFDALESEDTFDVDRKWIGRVVNGTAIVRGNRSDLTATYELAGVTRDPVICCYPTAGHVDLTVTRGEQSASHVYSFSDACGEVSVDNGARILELTPCP